MPSPTTIRSRRRSPPGTDPRTQRGHIGTMLAQFGVRASTPEDAHAAALDVHRKLSFLLAQFGNSGFPAELLSDCFEEKARRVLFSR